MKIQYQNREEKIILHWRKREEHPAEFEDGETLLVEHYFYGSKIMSLISYDSEKDTFYEGSARWDSSWEDVTYWIPLSELEATLPKEE